MADKAFRVFGCVGLVCAPLIGGACTTYGDELIRPPFSTGLPEGEQLSNLDREEVQQICDATDEFRRRQHERPQVERGWCLMAVVPMLAKLQASGMDGASLRGECLEMVTECLEAGVEFPPTECPSRMECNITVAELERCVDDTYQKIHDLPRCSEIVATDNLWEMVRVPRSCDKFLEECPD
jgi:hypothetical protein